MALGKQLARIFDFAINIPEDDVNTWDNSTSYEVHDFVTNSGTYYYCKDAHTSDTAEEDANEPGTGTDWEDYWIALGDTGYADIGGITSFSPSREKNDADVTDFDSQGWLEHIVASRGLSFDVEGYHIEDDTTGARNPGQYLIEQLALTHKDASIDIFRMINPSGTNIDFEVSADAPPEGISTGGGNDDPSGWSCTLTMTGQPNI
ncbi:MAG: phage tail tube protein [Bacillota bacterium]